MAQKDSADKPGDFVEKILVHPPNETIPGYSNIGFQNETILEPPVGLMHDIESNLERLKFADVPIITELEAKQALLEFVSSKLCYGKIPVTNMTLTDLQSSNTYRYLLQTFYETRSTQWRYEIYRGQVINNNGLAPPRPWDITVYPKDLFIKDKVKLEIPNTACIRPCNGCNGIGLIKCLLCDASGRKKCTRCRGTCNITVSDRIENCSFCEGCGTQACKSCNSTGGSSCITCTGSGRLKWYIELKVQFNTLEDDYFKKSETVPEKYLRKCQSVSTFFEQYPRVFAINHYHIQEVNRASNDLIKLHLNKLQATRIIMQAQTVFTIPITLSKYTFKGKCHIFYVFGRDRKVYAPDYPYTCCCFCLIL